jgi:hypothetical protein
VFVDIPLGKALVPEENKNGGCKGCFFDEELEACKDNFIACMSGDRKDGKNVIFKLVDCKKENAMKSKRLAKGPFEKRPLSGRWEE